MGVARVRGGFQQFAGTVEADEDGVHAEGTVEVASVQTGDALRDSMLPGGHFFDADAHPQISFAGRAPAGAGERFTLDGELVIRGVARPLRITVELAPARELPAGALAVHAVAELRRSVYGLRFDGPMAAGDRAVADRVAIELDLLALPA